MYLDYRSLFKGIVTISKGNSVYTCYLNRTYQFSPHNLLPIYLVEYSKLEFNECVSQQLFCITKIKF